MIQTYAHQKKLHDNRLGLKTIKGMFTNFITDGTNYSPFESEIIVEKGKEVFCNRWSCLKGAFWYLVKFKIILKTLAVDGAFQIIDNSKQCLQISPEKILGALQNTTTFLVREWVKRYSPVGITGWIKPGAFSQVYSQLCLIVLYVVSARGVFHLYPSLFSSNPGSQLIFNCRIFHCSVEQVVLPHTIFNG